MKKVFKTFFGVIKSYNVEEKVLSIVALGMILYGVVKLALVLSASGGILPESNSYTEGYVSNRPVLVSPLFMDFSNVNRDISSLVFSGLIKYDPSTKTFDGDLAELTISPDQMKYTFKLKDNVVFQDGTPVTADDVVFTFQDLIQSPDFENPILKADFAGVNITKIDDRTVSFEIGKPNSFFITNFVVGILPKHLLGDLAVTDLLTADFNQKPVGSGPYRLLKVENGSDGVQKVSLVLNDNYYGYKPQIKQIKFLVYPDVASMAHDRASLDVISKLNVNDNKDLENDPRFQKLTYTLPQYTAVFFNTDDPILKDQKVRVGLIKSVDKAGLLTSLPGRVQVDTPLMELNQQDWIFKANPKEAAGSLFDAGYIFDKDDAGNIKAGEIYRKNKDGKELDLTLTARQFDQGSALEAETQATVNYLIQAWKNNGVKVDVQYLAEQDFLNALDSKQYQMVLAGQTMGYNLDTFPFWHSSQAKAGGQNLSNYRSLMADSLIERIRATLDNSDKSDRLKKLASVIAGDSPALFLYRPSYLFLTDGKVQGIKMDDWSFIADRFAEISGWCVGNSCH